LFIARDIVKSYVIILFIIVLGAIADSIIKTIPGYTFTVLSNIIILIVLKVLYNIIATIKQFIIIEFTI